MTKRGLMDRPANGGVVCAEGYLFEMERRGYLTAGEFVPEVALEQPETLYRLHKDFQHAGSDVMQAFTYNAHREKLRMNCFRGPDTMLPYLRNIRRSVSCHVAALPVPYRTTAAQPTFLNLDDPNGCTCPAPHGRTFPTALDPLCCNCYEIRQFAAETYDSGINYLGGCCGAAPIHIREVAEAMGRKPAASRYAANMRKHYMYGDDERLPRHIITYGDKA